MSLGILQCYDFRMNKNSEILIDISLKIGYINLTRQYKYKKNIEIDLFITRELVPPID